MGLKQIGTSWKEVFRNWKYVTITMITAFVFYSINVLISSWQNITALYPNLGFLKTINFFFIVWIGFKSTIMFHSFISVVIISVLFGILMSLIFYKAGFNVSKNKKIGVLGGIGLFFGALAPGCVACGVGLASLLGLGAGALVFLPYEGLELSMLSIFLLSFAILKISGDLYTCNIPLRKNKIKMKGGIK